jgi:predicted DNA-binding transcriptional regulator YafY
MGKGTVDTLARQWLLLSALPRSPQRTTAGEIAQRLAHEGHPVSKRSVERDLQTLSAAFPIESDERSKPFGWSWQRDAPSFNLPGMSSLQAVVLMTAQVHLKELLPANQLDELKPLFAQARRTLVSTPAFEGQPAWPDKVAVASTSQALLPPKVDSAVLVSVHEAVYLGRQLELEYLGRGQIESKQYTVHPLGLIQRGPVSYLAVRIGNYADVRLLAVHRIQRATRLDAKATVPRGFKIASMVPEVAAGFERGKPIRLVLRMADHAAIHLWETPLSTDQTISAVDEDGFVKLKATVEDTAQLRWWLLGFGDYVKVLRPGMLAKELQATHVRAANLQ